MVGSIRTKWKGDLLIGRQQMQDNGTIPNDIVLSNDDLAVSRVHCRILYQDGFKQKKRLIPKAYMEFFKVFSDKHLARNPKVPYFPKELRILIISFLRKPRKFYIQDMGSVHGTYVKLKCRQQKKLLTGQTYQIGGTEVYINILQVQLPNKQMKIEETRQNDYEKTFMRYLSQEYLSGTQIYGLPKDSYICNSNIKRDQILLNQRLRPPFPYSFMKFEVLSNLQILSN